MTTRTYHIDPAHGDDTNDGLSPARPVKNHAERDIRPGDTVLFKRGSVIRGMLHTRNGAEGAPVTYGAYGEGEKPTFLGSVAVGDPAKWTEERPSIWRFTGTLSSEVCNPVFNGGEGAPFIDCWSLVRNTSICYTLRQDFAMPNSRVRRTMQAAQLPGPMLSRPGECPQGASELLGCEDSTEDRL